MTLSFPRGFWGLEDGKQLGSQETPTLLNLWLGVWKPLGRRVHTWGGRHVQVGKGGCLVNPVWPEGMGEDSPR